MVVVVMVQVVLVLVIVLYSLCGDGIGIIYMLYLLLQRSDTYDYFNCHGGGTWYLVPFLTRKL